MVSTISKLIVYLNEKLVIKSDNIAPGSLKFSSPDSFLLFSHGWNLSFTVLAVVGKIEKSHYRHCFIMKNYTVIKIKNMTFPLD